jgi:hypothetical protein
MRFLGQSGTPEGCGRPSPNVQQFQQFLRCQIQAVLQRRLEEDKGRVFRINLIRKRTSEAYPNEWEE